MRSREVCAVDQQAHCFSIGINHAIYMQRPGLNSLLQCLYRAHGDML